MFAYFKDDKQLQWSIQFESFEVAKKFALHVAIIINLYKNDEIYTMELEEGKGEEVDDGDSVGIYCEGYSVDRNKLGAPFGNKGW